MNQPIISGLTCRKRVLLWCTTCGPMGVSDSRDDAMMIAEQHLKNHGCSTDRSNKSE